MALTNPNFQIDISKELLQLTTELRDLEKLRDLETVTFDDQSNTYVFPPPTAYAPLSEEEYFDLMEQRAERYTGTSIAEKQQEILNVKQQNNQKYTGLKQGLQQRLLATGHNGPPILDFDDDLMSIEIGCGFKEFVDRFAPLTAQVRNVIAPDQQDTRPLQDIFRSDLAKPNVKQSNEDAFRNAISDCRDLGEQAYNDPENEVNLDGATTGDEAVDAVFDGDTGQPGMCLDDDHGNSNGPDFLLNNMASMGNAGVKTLFLEHFWQEQQDMIDAYLNGPPNAVLDPVLDTAITKLDTPLNQKANDPNKNPFRNLLIQAKSNGMRIVGLDSYDAKPIQGHPMTEDRRVAAFNAGAQKVVNANKGNGKFVLLAGSAHNNTDESGFPGLSQMLGIPALKPTDDGKLEKSPEENPREIRDEAAQAYYEAFIEQIFAANPDAFKGDSNAVKSRCANIRKAADELARKNGPMLGALDPAKVTQLAKQAADRVSQKIQTGEAALGGTEAAKQMLEAADGPAEYLESAGKIKDAIAKGNITLAMQLLDEVDDDRILIEPITDHPMGKQPAGTGLMHVSALSKNADLTRALMTRGVNPNHQNADGNTALHLATSNMASLSHRQFEEVATELLKSGAEINLENKAGDTPVHLLRSLQYTTTKSQENVGPHKSMVDLLALASGRDDFDDAKACRPGNMSQLLTACYHGDTAEINKLNPNDPILNQKLRGSTPLHAAAEGGHLDTVQALVNKGADLTIKAPRNRNVLHVLCASGNDDGPLTSYLINAMGGDSSARDEDGRTPLMLAAENGLFESAKQMLASPYKVFFNAADNTGMTPYMYSVLKSDINGGSCEQEFYTAFPELDQDGPGKKVSTVQMLKWMTNVDDPEEVTDELLETIYQELYDDPTLRPVLEIAARDGAGKRMIDPNRFGSTALRINASNGHGPAGGGGQGNYMPDGNRLNFGAKQNAGNSNGKGYWLDSVKGTLIHELTHHAAAITYDNYGIPVPKGDGENGNDPNAESAYVTAFEEDVRKNSHLAITEDEGRVVTLVSSRLQPYQKKLTVSGKELSGGQNMQLELIVGISQAIAEFGLPLVRKLYPSLTKHYLEVFANDIEERCQQDDLTAPDLDMTLDEQKKPTSDGPDIQFSPSTKLDSEAIWKMVESEFTFEKKRLNGKFAVVATDGVPIWNVSCLELDPTDTKLLNDLKPLVTKLLDNELKNSDLPPQLSTERIRELVRTVSGECLKVDPNKSLKGEAGKILGNIKQAGTDFRTNASQDFENDYLSSTRQRLARLTNKNYTLSPRNIAELTVIRASDSVSGANTGDEAVSVNPKKLAQIVDFLESKIAEQMKKDPNVQIDAESYVSRYVDLLVKDKTFFMKKKGKGTGHVSTKVSSVKSLWKKKLRKIKV